MKIKFTRNHFLIFFVAFLIFSNVIFNLDNSNQSNKKTTLSSFLEEIDSLNNNGTSEVVIFNDGAEIKREDGTKSKVYLPQFFSIEMIKNLSSKKLSFDYLPIDSQRGLFERVLGLILTLISWIPMFFFAWIFLAPFFNKNKNKDGSGSGIGGSFMGGMNPFGFAKNKAKLIMPKDSGVKFSDVAGIDEAKEDVVEIVDFLKNPKKFHEIGARIPRGCMLIGEPGTGKTLLAKAIASEAFVPFFYISGSDFVEMFAGVGASRVRDMFAQAKNNAPCIIFIDEIDAVGRHRGHGGFGGANDEREQTLNQLLVEMDGFEEKDNIVVIAATNRIDVLDQALLRPGRFDRQIFVNLPDIKGRKQILEVHAKKIKYSPDVSLQNLARSTPGLSGADLANIINESALLAAKRNKKVVTMVDMEDARDKILMGAERKSMSMKPEEKELTAYHEAGHALLALHLPSAYPIHKATIIPRMNSLGSVTRLPEEDLYHTSKEQLESSIMIAMGGRIAELFNYGENKVTNGAASDIEQITGIAKKMVMDWGLSDKIGMIKYSICTNTKNNDNDFISQTKADLIDQEIKEKIDSCYKKAYSIIENNMEQLHLLATNLIEYETLSGEEIKKLIFENIPIKEQRDKEEEEFKKKIKSSSIFSKKEDK